MKAGVFSEPRSTETRFARVDVRDVGKVAAIAPMEDRLSQLSQPPRILPMIDPAYQTPVQGGPP